MEESVNVFLAFITPFLSVYFHSVVTMTVRDVNVKSNLTLFSGKGIPPTVTSFQIPLGKYSVSSLCRSVILNIFISAGISQKEYVMN